MMHDVFVAAASAATGAATVPALKRLWECVRPKPQPKWEPFEPGDCIDLPLHEWSYVWKRGMTAGGAFVCPKCQTFSRGQPPFCSERGGHYHFKCIGTDGSGCSYEWAMRTADWEPPKPQPTGVAS